MVWSATGKKKAARNAAHQQGDDCVEDAGVPATPPSSISQRCRGHRLRTAKQREVLVSTQMTTLSSATGRSVISSTKATTHPSCDGLKVTSLPTAALCSHGIELLPILQNLSIDVHQNIVCFLNKLFPTPFVRHPSSCFHQSDVLIFKRHILYAVNSSSQHQLRLQ